MDSASDPLISVVIPTYNRAHLLSRAVRSVLRQTWSNFELIIVDDASTDGTAQIVGTFNDPRIFYIRRKNNGGSSATRNAGIKAARGKYLAFLDDDDEYLPEYLSAVDAAFDGDTGSVKAFVCQLEAVRNGSDGRQTSREITPSVRQYEDRRRAQLEQLRTTPFGTASLSIDIQCFQEVGLFDESLHAGVDREFFVRYSRKFDFGLISRTLIRKHEHDGPQLTDRTPLRAESYERILHKYDAVLRTDSNVFCDAYCTVAGLYYSAGKSGLARQALFRSVFKRPLHARSWKVFVYHDFWSRLPGNLSGSTVARS